MRDAQERLELDRIIEAVKTLQSHQKKVLYVIVSGGMKEVDTATIYTHYKKLCENMGYPPLSKVRISNFIAELDMLGLISAKKIYRGRYGRIRLVPPNVPSEEVLSVLAEE